MNNIILHTGPKSAPVPVSLPIRGMRWTTSTYVFKRAFPKPPPWATDRLDTITAEERDSDSFRAYTKAVDDWRQDKADREDRFYQCSAVWYGDHRWQQASPDSDVRDLSMPVHETFEEIAALFVAAGGVVIPGPHGESA